MAACSTYHNRAVINEIHNQGAAEYFIEIKLLDTGITGSVFDSWTVTVCNYNNECTTSLSLAEANQTNSPWIVIPKAIIGSENYLDIRNGMDIILRDGSGNTIDYFSAESYTFQQDDACSPAYDWNVAGSNTQTLNRTPDGTGEWGALGPGGSLPPSEGGTNDNDPAPDGNPPPVLNISNVSIPEGSTATFTLTIDGSKPFDVAVNYETLDGTAIAANDYIYTNGTAVIPAGATATTVDVTTFSNSLGGDHFFYLFLSNPMNAVLANHFAVGTITNADGGSIDHYEISYDGTALTCAPEAITVRACETTDCATLYSGDIEITMSTTGGNWAGGATQIFNGGSTTFSLRDSAAETVIVGVSSASPSATNPPQCSPSCNVRFHDSGFDFSVPTQTGCLTSGNITISAVKKDDATQQCVPAFSNRTESINFWTSYMNPVTPSVAADLSVNGTDVGKAEVSATPISLNFDGNGRSTITVRYPEAGQIRLDAKFTGIGAEAGLIITGASTFVVRPAGLCVYTNDTNANCPAGDEACSKFVVAGQTFNMGVRAVCYEAPEETNTQFCTGNATTQNFQMNNIAISANLVAPAAGSNGVTGVNTFNMIASDNGDHTINNQSISEVGVFTFTAAPPDYLGAGDVIPVSTSANIGRFYPDHFTTSITNGDFADSCGSFSYTGQPFTYATAPAVTITARNLNNINTANYRDNFRLLTAGDITLSYPVADSTNVGNDLITPMALAITPGAAALSTISPLSYMLGADIFTYTRTSPTETDNALVAPFTSDITISLIAVSDSDGVTADDLVTPKSITPTGGEIRYGRSVALHGYGPETDPISILFYTEYFNGLDWQTNAQDNCSTVPYTKTEDGTIAVTAALPSPLIVAAGQSALTLTPDTDPNPPGGTVIIDYNVDPWLETDPQATATFGIYKGNNRIINWQEIMR